MRKLRYCQVISHNQNISHCGCVLYYTHVKEEEEEMLRNWKCSPGWRWKIPEFWLSGNLPTAYA